MENTLVWCKTKAEVRGVLSEAKNMGYRIYDLDDYTERFWGTHETETVINLNGDGKVVTYCYKDWYIEHPGYGKIITADKFLGRKPILITRKGRVVIAENKNTGEKAIVTCSPDDTYDFDTGALIAVARLVAKEIGISGDAEIVLRGLLSDKPVAYAFAEKTTKFKVGDLVTLKNGLEPGEVYRDMTLYPGDMFDSLNGKPKKVIRVCERSTKSPIYQTESEWYYSEEMLDKWDENAIHEGDIVRVVNTGLNYTSYPQWVGKYISDPDMAARYCFDSPSVSSKYKVIKIAEHESNGRTLAYIEEIDGFDYNSCYLIEVKGLKKVTE